MLSKFKMGLVSSLLTLGLSTSANASVLDPFCHGQFFNPVSHPNTNNFFPITIFGQAFGAPQSDNPPIMYSGATCNCPSIILGGTSVPGITLSYWRPSKIIDVSRIPGCSPSLGGKVLLDGYAHNLGVSTVMDAMSGKRQIMEWDYDVLGLLKIFEALACTTISSISLAYDSNLDPTMNSLPNGNTGESEATLFFKDMPMLLACAVDQVVALVQGYSFDALPQCSGAQTNSYPYENTTSQKGEVSQLNLKAAVDHIVYKQTARFKEWLTIGPTAQCFSHPSYFPVKSAYRFDRTWPVADKGSRHMPVGTPLTFFDGSTRNVPGVGDTTILTWKANQCCLKAVP